MELFRALGALLDAPCSENRLIGHLLELGSAPDEPTHNEIFLFQLYPYASAFLGPDGRVGGEARDRVAGFWRALETDPPPEPDHLGALLAGYAAIVEAEQGASGRKAEAWREARRAFLWEHLLSWAFPFLAKLRQIAPPFYQRWADTLEAVLMREAKRIDPPLRAPLAFRAATPVPDPRARPQRPAEPTEAPEPQKAGEPQRAGEPRGAGEPQQAGEPPGAGEPQQAGDALTAAGPRDARPAAVEPEPRGESPANEFIAALLSPVRSGLVLTRADLARAARDLGLGLRVGERAYILRAMLSQGPRETLGWLAAEAKSWESEHGRDERCAPAVFRFWGRRAAATRLLVGELRDDLPEPTP